MQSSDLSIAACIYRAVIVYYLFVKSPFSFILFSIIISVYLALTASDAVSEPVPAAQPQHVLDSLRRELRRIDGELESGSVRERGVLKELDASERRVAVLSELVRDQKRQLYNLQDSIRFIETEIGPRETELARLGRHLITLEDDQQRLSAVLVRALLAEHRLSGIPLFDFLFAADSWGELLARRAALKRLQRTAEQSLQMLAVSVDTLQETEDAVFTSTQVLRERKWQLESNRRRTTDISRDVQNDIADLEHGKNSLQSRLKKLRQDRKLLEQHRQEIAASQAQIEEMIGKIARGEPLSGMPLAARKGALPWPVIGRVVVKFGAVKNPALATITENPGIEITASAEAAVSSVAEGRVSSVTWLRGYGNVCIVEHPGSFYTVYAKLGQVVVKSHEEVKAGSVIGYPGFDAASEDYRVHFELWSGKEKKNPIEWLQPR
jgi:murein hydrolase activator